MRVFAGPNGSGKSTVIAQVRKYKTSFGKLDFGIYINADDIVNDLKEGKFKFSPYEIKTNEKEFHEIISQSGLINKDFTSIQFNRCHTFTKEGIKLKNDIHTDRLAQILADFLRKKLLKEKKKFSFETVFSHKSKLDIMRQANAEGYKVYLYFVSTSSPEINKSRVELRVKKGGHDVPRDKIESRYYRSLDLMFEAAQLSYQTFFWDNSKSKPELFKHFKVESGKKKWKKVKGKEIPSWFIKYYSDKVAKI